MTTSSQRTSVDLCGPAVLGDVHPLLGVVGDEDPVGALLPRLVRVLGGRGDHDAVVEGHDGLGLAVNPQEEALAAPAYQTRPEEIILILATVICTLVRFSQI